MRVAIYTRISPNPDKDDTTNQETDLETYAKAMGWEIVARYKDIHISGSKKGNTRTDFKRMMEDANKRKFDILLFWSLDRLSREGVPETLNYLTRLNSYGVNYKSYTEQYFDSCGIFKDAIIAILATVAKQERIRIVERTLAGLQTARNKGVKLGRPKADINHLKVMEMRGKGWSLAAIAKQFKVHEATISRLVRRKNGTKTETEKA